MKNCENCGVGHDGDYGSGRFCSNTCARSFSSKKFKITTKKLKCSYCDKILVVDSRSGRVTCDECKNTRHKKVCPTCGDEYSTIRSHQIYCSNTCKNNHPDMIKKHRDNAKKQKFGGHTSKKSVKYECKDGTLVYLQSSYEHCVAIDLDRNNIKWIRPEPLLWVDSDSIEHRYYPDFYLVDYDVYLDPKNDYLIIKDEYKIHSVSVQNNVIVLILNKEQLSWNEISKHILV